MIVSPTPSGWVFYVSNLVIVSGYLFAALMIGARRGPAKNMNKATWLAALAFFLFCGGTHIQMALHSLFHIPMVAPDDGRISWYVLVVHVPQAVSIWVFLLGQRARKPQAAEPVPLEGAVAVEEPRKKKS